MPFDNLAYKTTVRGLAVGAAVAALAGCGSSPNQNAPASAVDACLQLQQAWAEREARCAGGSVADWLAYQQAYQDCSAVRQHLLDGNVEYHPEVFAGCLAAIQSPCDQTDSDLCPYGVIRGLVPDGQPCRDYQVCGTSSTCLNVDSRTCGEVCARLAVEGEKCGFYCGGAAPCLEIAWCGSELACVNETCVKPKRAGEACGGSDFVPCGQTLYCTADPADPLSTGTCEARATGTACHGDVDCLTADFCDQGTCSTRRRPGASCADALTGCEQWSTCGANGTCVAAGMPGGVCLTFPADPPINYCYVGFCDPSNVCVDWAHPGDSCETNSCAAGSLCDPATLTCVPCGS